MSKASEKDLGELHGLITRKLSAALEGDEVAGTTIANAIAWMKHNQITADPESNEGLNELQRQLRERNKRTPIAPQDLAQAQRELEAQLGLGGKLQ